MVDDLGHPTPEEMELSAIFAALADPIRRHVVIELAMEPDQTRDCSSFELPVTKATRTHHFRVLRESGLLRQVDHGNRRTNQLRRKEIEQRFPGLIALVLSESRAIEKSGSKRR
jgi:DNA-binding transcriptional ArsR family regulator